VNRKNLKENDGMKPRLLIFDLIRIGCIAAIVLCHIVTWGKWLQISAVFNGVTAPYFVYILIFVSGAVLAYSHPAVSFDAVCFFEAIEHFTEYEQQSALNEILAVLKPNGKVFFSTPNRELTIGNNCYHLRELNPEELRKLLWRWNFNNIVIKGVAYDGVVHDEPDGCPILFGRCEK
jgi:SAM-dependent methyltransferase